MLKLARSDSGLHACVRKGSWLTHLVLMVGVATLPIATGSTQAPPSTDRDDVREVLHGVEIVDPYRWLEDQNSPETREWITAQNDYSKSVIGSIPGRAKLKQELTELMRIDPISIPTARNGRYFFSRRLADQDLSVIHMREGPDGEDEVLIDPHGMSPDHRISVTIRDISQDGGLLAYGIREGGEDEVTVGILNVDERGDLPDRLPKARYFDICIRPDRAGIYYSRHGDEGSRVYYHAMGTEPAEDTDLFGKAYGPDKGITIDLSEDGHYLLLTVWHGSAAARTEIYYQDVLADGEIVTVVNDIEARFEGHIGGDHLFMQTNWKAPNGRILAVNLNDPAQDKWREIIPERDAVMTGFSLAGGRIVVNYQDSVIPTIKVFEPAGKFVASIDPAGIGSLSRVRGRWESDEAFFSFSSFHIPTTIYRYDLRRLSETVWAQVKVPIDSENFQIRQVWCDSRDGTKVPMFIVHSKDIEYDGSNPTILTGYGGFRASLTPGFSSKAAFWIKHGGVYAMANLRGGGEFGERWHRAGMLDKKQNTFDDFIAAAEWLIENKYTRPEKLAISGGSNGGLLVGAALTQRPELFQAVVCAYPLLDMVRYHKFLVARLWISEYGSSEDPDQFNYIYAYSPYHQVREGTEYPAVLFITGDSDTRVDPLHARKMTARLQAATASNKPVLLLYDTKAGHSGAKPLTRRIDDLADQLLFLFWQLGIPIQ